MALVPTPHIQAENGEIAESILLPGDPLRAKFIAETYLDNVRQFNSTRNMLGFTGTFEGKPVSVMGTGMGTPSIGIYSYELIHFYGCKTLIRTGTAGAIRPELKIGDMILAMGACYTSYQPSLFANLGYYAPICSFDLLQKASSYAESHSISYQAGNVLTTDLFYTPFGTSHSDLSWSDLGVLAVEMETAMLYLNAASGNAKALTILTVSDSLVTGESASAKVRETSFTQMMETALYTAITN